jgi:hypothetical protein
MKGDRLIRISLKAWKEVQDFKNLHNLKKDREALEKLVREAWHTRLYLKYFLEHRDATQEEPECPRRILLEGDWYCAKKAPHIYVLPTLDICRACMFRVFSWKKRAEHPPVSSPASLEAQDTTKPIREVYCVDMGLYVRKTRCDQCKTKCGKQELFT